MKEGRNQLLPETFFVLADGAPWLESRCLEYSGSKDSLGDLVHGALRMAGLHVHCVEDQERRVLDHSAWES